MAGITISNAVGLLGGRINYLDQRHQLMVENLANVDTPGFKARDLSFQGFVESAMTGSDEHAVLPNGEDNIPKLRTEIVTREGHEKADGNNVNLENEMANMTDNSIEFMTATEILKRHLSLVKYSISDR